jgi:predicted PhzF superfamily epimerase YddE/YHI9
MANDRSHRRYMEVDVFTHEAYRGNPLAVLIDGDGLHDDVMQRFANWTNFSETTFLLPPRHPDADYRVRIFTTSTELPFAGHPTLGSCHAGCWPAARRRIHGGSSRSAAWVWWRSTATRTTGSRSPPRRCCVTGPLDDATLASVVEVLGVEPTDVLDAAWIDNGPGWLGVLLDSADCGAGAAPGRLRPQDRCGRPHATGHEAAYEVRAFFPEGTHTFEDPVTGSLNASLAQWLVATGRFTPPYVASQGTVLGRAGRVRVDRDDTGQLWIGGGVVTCVTVCCDGMGQTNSVTARAVTELV